MELDHIQKCFMKKTGVQKSRETVPLTHAGLHPNLTTYQSSVFCFAKNVDTYHPTFDLPVSNEQLLVLRPVSICFLLCSQWLLSL
jgi:hypothetical protein